VLSAAGWVVRDVDPALDDATSVPMRLATSKASRDIGWFETCKLVRAISSVVILRGAERRTATGRLACAEFP